MDEEWHDLSEVRPGGEGTENEVCRLHGAIARARVTRGGPQVYMGLLEDVHPDRDELSCECRVRMIKIKETDGGRSLGVSVGT